MDKQNLSTSLILFFVILAIINSTQAQNEPDSPEAVEKWFKSLRYKRENLTKLHFYFHDTVSGNNRSVLTVAKSNAQAVATAFGSISVIDDPLTEGPEDNSTIMGRAQGIFTSSSMEDSRFLMALNFVFTNGPFNGSTLSVLGHNPILHKYREMPVLGGSGVFRLARGIATARTVWFNLASLNAVVEYHVVVLHY